MILESWAFSKIGRSPCKSVRGQGIDEAEQAYIFDKFCRGSRHRLLHGTGMGLAIAKAILRAHSGGIEVVSHRGQGATFTFWVPLTPHLPAPSA